MSPRPPVDVPPNEVAAAYVPVVRGYLLAAACYYVVISCAHPFFEVGANLLYLEGLAVIAALSAGLLWRDLKRRPPSMLRLEVAAVCVNLLLLVNVVAYLTIHFEPLKLVYFVLMALVFGTSAPSRRVAFASVAMAVTGFLMLARNAPGDLIGQYAFVGVAGVFAAIGMSTLMRGAVMRELGARIASDELNRALGEKLAENDRLRAEAQELAVSAQAASRAKTEFLATISHEIRTPLNGVLGMAHVMAQSALPPEQAGRLQLIQSSARSLLDVVNDVLDISKIEAGRMEIVPAPFSMDRFAEAIDRLYGGLAQDKGLAFALELDPGAAGWRFGDEVRLRQVLSNLLSNAIKFTDQGGVKVRIAPGEDGIVFTVADTGPGVSPAHQAVIFDRFVQGDGSSTRRASGTGLGLAICREVITLMGGAIRLHSQPGQGATFTFEAPLPRVEAPEEAEGEVADALVQGELRVLIADDNPTNRVVLQTLLSHLGVASEAVGDGLKAVEAWSDRPWDVILMDIHMPEMDGLDASRLIRRREAELARPRTPIVAVTASVLTHETEAYYAAGMDNVIAKPIEATRLVEVLQQSLSQAAPSAVQVA
ncbi:ATP-binding protein [Phenylobacterium sp.]|uniref:ATP-binding protein n=1 Tax=Phenylobacterium sp. TaxID=1871053 RepID=UPI0035B11F43